jgi:uncharacterized protein YcaQ
MMSAAASASPEERIGRQRARRIALAAQGFGQRRPNQSVSAAEIRAVINRLGLLQLDSVNVFCRSHYMPIFSRLGAYDRSELDRMAMHTAAAGHRELVEYWGHQASLLPIDLYPLLRWRMQRVDLEAWKSLVEIARSQPALIAQTQQLVSDHGPIRASATGGRRPARQPGEMWNWHEGKQALEYLFYAGRVSAAGRINFERLYDLPERVLPSAILDEPSPSETDAQRQLVRIAAQALGVATEPDLGDYFRLTRADSRTRVAELVAADELIPVTVDGWSAPAYLWPAADQRGQLNARALLSPFDSLIWTRQRTERLFDFVYRVEIYTPAAKRVYGYYVLPFLLGDELVARVDLKSDRQRGALLVQGAFHEPDVDIDHVAGELAVALRDAAGWLGLDDIVLASRGNLAAALTAAI